MGGAIIPAAIAMIVATLVYGWQRHLEHAFLLRKEKRDFYRQINRLIVEVNDSVLSQNGKFRECEASLRFATHELLLYGEDETEIASAILNIRKRYDKFNRDFGELSEEEKRAAVHDIAVLEGDLMAAMRDDLSDTVDIWRPMKRNWSAIASKVKEK